MNINIHINCHNTIFHIHFLITVSKKMETYAVAYCQGQRNIAPKDKKKKIKKLRTFNLKRSI